MEVVIVIARAIVTVIGIDKDIERDIDIIIVLLQS